MNNDSTATRPSVHDTTSAQPILRNTEHFQPGENLYIKPEWLRKAEPQYKQVTVNAPGRLVFTVFNLACVSGGMGISTNTVGTEILIRIDNQGNNNIDPVWNHLLILFKKITGYNKNNISLDITKQIGYKHAGFGSNIVFSTAVIAGLNALFGLPFSINEVWEIIIKNYMEKNEHDEHLFRGYSSGIGAACLLYGDLVWIDEGTGQGDGKYLGKFDSGDLWVLTGVGNMENLQGTNIKNKSEYSTYINVDADAERIKFRLEFQKNNDHILKPYFNSLKTNLILNDLENFLCDCWKINDIGAKSKSIDILYKVNVFKDLWRLLKDNGASYAGSSSIGPGFFALASTENKIKELRDIVNSQFNEYFHSLNISKAGKRMAISVE